MTIIMLFQIRKLDVQAKIGQQIQIQRRKYSINETLSSRPYSKNFNLLRSVNKEHVITAFLDIEAAYPNVQLPILAKILRQIGLPAYFVQYILLMYTSKSRHFRPTSLSHVCFTKVFLRDFLSPPPYTISIAYFSCLGLME